RLDDVCAPKRQMAAAMCLPLDSRRTSSIVKKQGAYCGCNHGISIITVPPPACKDRPQRDVVVPVRPRLLSGPPAGDAIGLIGVKLGTRGEQSTGTSAEIRSALRFVSICVKAVKYGLSP